MSEFVKLDQLIKRYIQNCNSIMGLKEFVKNYNGIIELELNFS